MLFDLNPKKRLMQNHCCRTVQSRIILFMVITLLLSTAYGQDCTSVLGYVRDTSTVDSLFHSSSSFKRFFCDQTFSSYQQARDSSQKLGIAIEDLPISFENHDRTSEWQVYQRTMCDRIESFSSLDTSFRSMVTKANDTVVKAWSDCMSSPGVKFWADVNDSNPQLVILNARFNSIGAPYQAKINPALQINPASNLNCGPNQLGTYVGFFAGFGSDNKNYIDNKVSQVTCTRTNKAAVNVVLKTERGDQAVIMPVILTPKPPAPPPEMVTTTVIKSQFCTVLNDQWTGEGPKIGDKHLFGMKCSAPGPIEARADSSNLPHVDTISMDGGGCPWAARLPDLDLFVNPTTVNLRVASNSADACTIKYKIYYKEPTTSCTKNCPAQ